MSIKREVKELSAAIGGASNSNNNNYRHKKFNSDYTHKKFGMRCIDAAAAVDDSFENTLANNKKHMSRSTANIFRPYALEDDTHRKRKMSTSHWAVNQLAAERQEQDLAKRYASSEDIFRAATLAQQQMTKSVYCLQQEQQKQHQFQQQQQQYRQQQYLQRCVSLEHINKNPNINNNSGIHQSQRLRQACSTAQLPSALPFQSQAVASSQQQRKLRAPTTTSTVNYLQSAPAPTNLPRYQVNKEMCALMLQKQSAALMMRQHLFRSSGNINHAVYNGTSQEVPTKSNMTTAQLLLSVRMQQMCNENWQLS